MRWKPTVTSNDVIMHSAKGSHWKNHKYIKVVGGKYIYPETMGAGLRRLASDTAAEKIDEEKRREREKQAQANRSKAQRQGMKRTFDEKERQREATRQRQEAARAEQEKGKKRTKYFRDLANEKGERGLYSQYDKKLGRKWDNEDTNERNLNAARNKANARRNQQQKADYDRAALNQRNLNAARKKALRNQRNAEGAAAARKQINDNLTNRNLNAARTKKERQDAQARINVRKSARAQQERGKQLTTKLRQQRLAEQRNAAGRTSARRQIEAGNKAAANEAARQRKVNAVNTTRAAQRRGMERTAQVSEQARINRNKQQKADYDRAELNKRNLSAARAKALRNQRNEEGRAAASKQIRQANSRALGFKAARNVEGRAAAKRQITEGNQKMTARRVYNKGLMNERASVNRGQSNGSWKMDDPRTRNKAKGKRPARLDVAAKQTLNKIGEEAYRTGYKVRKTASNAGKSISARARAAWNSASSYKDRFADFESFYKWYKKYGTK